METQIENRRLTLLVLSGDMEKGLAACNLALAGLAAGREVTLFFTFWGLNLLKKPKARSRGPLLARLLSLFNRDSATRQRMGRFQLLGGGPWALSRLMRGRGLPGVLEGLAMAHGMGARILACSNTLDLLGYDRSSLIAEVDGVVGAAAFLECASEGQTITLS
jgi:peroxiredoxin family protein